METQENSKYVVTLKLSGNAFNDMVKSYRKIKSTLESKYQSNVGNVEKRNNTSVKFTVSIDLDYNNLYQEILSVYNIAEIEKEE